jgi:hypothetical protein
MINTISISVDKFVVHEWSSSISAQLLNQYW